VDPSGNIYVGIVAGELGGESWVAKLSPKGTGIGWVTFLSGTLLQLALAPDGSLDCLTQVESGQGAALTKLSASGQSLATASVPSLAQALAVGADGSVYIGGQNYGSGLIATPGAWQTTSSSGFLAKMNPSLSGFAWLTFVDGNVSLIHPALDNSLWISGATSDLNFPVLPSALQPQLSSSGNGNGFLVDLSADGSKALASTYLPGSPTSLALDSSGNVIFGALYQTGFQATPGAQWPCPQPKSALGFFGKIDAAGQHLLWGTWSGPSIPVGPAAVDKNGNALVVGNFAGGENITLAALTTLPGPPRLVSTCIGQAAYPYMFGPLAPGEIISIYGAGFGPQQGVSAQPTGNTIGTELGGVQVLIEDTPAPLLYVSAAQINLVAPYLLDGRTAAHIKIVTTDATSNEVVLGVQPSAPEIFESQPGTAALLNQDGTVNGPNNPMHIGDTVALFVSGVGQTMPPGMDGAIAQATGGTPLLPVAIHVSSAGTMAPNATVTYAGNAPGLVSGLVQINFQMPPVARIGAGPTYPAFITLSVGAASTDLGPMIWFE
jgi:uncharacterized protein (TIGR03437 family)